MGTSTRKAEKSLSGETLPDKNPTELMRELYHHKVNAQCEDPSSCQNMAGIIYPGNSRLDYDFNVESEYFLSYNGAKRHRQWFSGTKAMDRSHAEW